MRLTQEEDYYTCSSYEVARPRHHYLSPTFETADNIRIELSETGYKKVQSLMPTITINHLYLYCIFMIRIYKKQNEKHLRNRQLNEE